MLLPDQVTRRRATTASDGYGNPTSDWSSVTEVVYPAEVQPASTDENVVDQDRTVTRWRAWLPAAADLVATDRIVWDGDTYEIDGDVQRWKQRGVPHHIEVLLVKVTQR